VALGELDGDPVVVSGGIDGTVRISEARTGQQRGEPLTLGDSHFLGGLFPGGASAVALGELDGEPVVVSNGEDSTVRIWEARTGQPRGKPLPGHEGRVTSVALGELGGEPVIVSGDSYGTVRIWEGRTGQPAGETITGHDDQVTSVALGELGGEPVIVSGSSDRTVRIWDARSSRLLVTMGVGSSVHQAVSQEAAVAIALQRGVVCIDLATPLGG
jgi:WD40 repeat protein